MKTLYKEAEQLNISNICRIRKGKCIAVRLGLMKRICNYCTDLCNHFKNGCTIKNIPCKVWLCNPMTEFQSEEFKYKQEEILLKAKKLGYNKYALSNEEIEVGVKPPFNSTQYKRLDKYIK